MTQTSTKFDTVAKIIASTTDEKTRIKKIEKAFKTAGLSGSKIILADAEDLSKGVISLAEFEHRLEERTM